TAILFVCISPAEAQQAQVYRLGFLSGGFPGRSPNIEALRQGLRDLGYVDGKNIIIEYRFAEGNDARYPSLLSDLIRLKVESSSPMVAGRHGLPRRQLAPFPLL